ncbi:unnamed protein product, partial [Cyprideis torosa]
YFKQQLALVAATGLPLFLHCRNAAEELADILEEYASSLKGGVIHSYDGSLEDAQRLLKLGFHIGINGCSLKTKENLTVAAELPEERLLLETDAPWCEIRPSHAGHGFIKTIFKQVKKEKWEPGLMVKGRNEPCQITQVLEVLAAVRKQDEAALASTIFQNTMRLFFPKESLCN